MDTTENELGGDFDLAFTLSKVGKGGGLICCYSSPRNMDSKSSNKIKRWFVKLQITFYRLIRLQLIIPCFSNLLILVFKCSTLGPFMVRN